MSLVDRVAVQLGDDGAFARDVPGFAPRAGQIVLAREIAAAIEAGEHLVAEAGTGIGKTFAYLAPILAGHRRAIVSTATRTLQDQLFERDLPCAAGVLGRPRTAVLKGRDNYLCRERWLRASEDWVGFEGARFDHAALAAWAQATRTGDLAELRNLGETSSLRRLLTTSAEACLGANCPEYTDCHVYAARREAQAAQVVIVNHHLFLADLRLKHEGFSDGLLGPADVVVVDEAHALPEVARNVLGELLPWTQLKELADDAVRAFGGDEDIRGAVLELTAALRFADMRLEPGRHAWHEAAERMALPVEALGAALDRLANGLEALPETAPLVARVRDCASRLERLTSGDAENTADFRWVEAGVKGQLSIQSSPLEPGATLAEWIAESGASWIMTSATLAVAGGFDNFTRQIGLDAHRSLLIGSPFDYTRQALLYLPSGMPDANEEAYTEAVVAMAEPLLRAAHGGAFLLFTSRKALRRAAGLLRSLDLDKPLFVQGEAPQARLLEDFRATGNGMLCGTASFWKGVDVKGEALELVVIDRLPFAWPDDPLFKARLAHCREAGGNPFADIQIPEAALALKQGAGRLIRDGADRGVLTICDPRLRTRGYGKIFRASLPPMPVTRDANEAVAFLSSALSQKVHRSL